MAPSDKPNRFHAAWLILACALVLALFAGIAWTAVRGKTAVYDEPLDVIEGYMVTRYRDYRISPSTPVRLTFSALLGVAPR